MSAQPTPGIWKVIKGIAEGDSMRCGIVVTQGKREFLIATIENGAPGDFCETEEANAHLMSAARELHEAATAGLASMESVLALILESHCLLDTSHEPRRDTLEPEVRAEVELLEAKIAQARGALAKAGGTGTVT